MISTIENYQIGILDAVIAQAGPGASSTAKGNVFCKWCLENIFIVTNDEALDAMEVSGSYDHSIDAFVISEEKVMVFQTKFESAHSWSAITKFHYDIQRIKERKIREREASDKAQRVIARIQDAYMDNQQVEYYYITSAQFTDMEKSKLGQLPGYGVDCFFYDLQEIALRLDRRQQDIPDTVRNQWFPLLLSSREMLKFADSTAVIAVSLGHMHDFVAQATDDLFASNVRQYLRSTKINSGIRQTIQKNPERFWLYNNGITIVCDDFVEEGFALRIKTPQIVNGCQTARSISDILSKKNQEERNKTQGHVLVRIIKGSDDLEKENITRYTNTQNAVRGKDFFSLDKLQKKLHKSFKSLSYYYEIQRGSFASLKASERAKYKGDANLAYLVDTRFKGSVPALEAIQAYAAGFKQIPGIAYGAPYELAPSGTWYNKVFEDEHKPDPESFLYTFLVREWAIKFGYSRGGEGGWRAYSALFFVYAYFAILVEVLKNLKLVESLEILPQDVPTHIWDKIFRESQLNEQLLKATDDILERYFSDSTVHDAVGLDVRKFLKTFDTVTKYRSILFRQADSVITSARDRKLVNQLAQLLKS